ncbi:MAG: alkaline phosphatase family protein [Kiritimatiellia bacterium]|jgi:predicted AlkP superfamily pyrophosphatase or phosphodiesterase|nr:alkaline phosphatase family protein [Kiritimatiellia bacterium]MDP6629774.1 alkaline phosphatase family protein [Kiritimatiellia bacterium]MDP6811050.1 alkaline phosphatase family protein [Kiritimatiellia bacterium]MDP7023095.1 alkaline phosphatase family protein [Kiritimatiellia bacterium]
MKKMLVISVAGLDTDTAAALSLQAATGPAALQPPFPAVTCTAQASFRTAAPAAQHGMVANGLYDRALRKVSFWEQSSALVEGPRLWDAYRAEGRSVGMLFWQQSLGEAADYILSPAPIHKHHGGLVRDCYSQPRDMYTRLRDTLGEFPLQRYWGPFASASVGEWIASATADVMAHEAPDLLLTYLPTLDYDFQRTGPHSPAAARATAQLDKQLHRILAACDTCGYEWIVWGDYAITPTMPGGALFPNRMLRQAGLLSCREVHGRSYPDFHRSAAFAMVDHAVAHVYLSKNADEDEVARLMTQLEGVDLVQTGKTRGDVHPRCGDLVLTAAPGHWFAYPWWDHARQAPDYATHVDIHNKPGFDPCELFMRWIPPGVGQDPQRVGGTHGRADSTTAWAASIAFNTRPATLIELANSLKHWLALSLPSQDPDTSKA